MHSNRYVDELEAARPAQGYVYLDGGDTMMEPSTWEVILRGVGGTLVQFLLEREHRPHAGRQTRAELSTPADARWNWIVRATIHSRGEIKAGTMPGAAC